MISVISVELFLFMHALVSAMYPTERSCTSILFSNWIFNPDVTGIR